MTVLPILQDGDAQSAFTHSHTHTLTHSHTHTLTHSHTHTLTHSHTHTLTHSHTHTERVLQNGEAKSAELAAYAEKLEAVSTLHPDTHMNDKLTDLCGN